MKNLKVTVLSLLATALIVACAGIETRRSVQVPAMQLAWSRVVKPAVDRGVATLVESARPGAKEDVRRFDEAIRSGLPARISPLLATWRASIRNLFLFGVRDRLIQKEIGPRGAEILAETGRQFDANMTLLAAR